MAETYEDIDRPFGSLLQRESDNYVSDLVNQDVEGNASPQSGEESLSNLWIGNWIRSKNWKPKTSGFYLDGATGYAEFSNVFITGSISLDNSSAIFGGQTDYNTGTGFFLGYSGGAYKFSIGTPGVASMTWDGSNLSASNLELTYPFVAKEAIDIGDTVAVIPPSGVRNVAEASSNNATTFINSGNSAYDIIPAFAVVFKTTSEATGISYIDAGSASIIFQSSDGSQPSSGMGYGVALWDSVNKEPVGSYLVTGNMGGSKPFFYFPNSGILSVNKDVLPNTYYCLHVYPRSWSSNTSGGDQRYIGGDTPVGEAENPTLWFQNASGIGGHYFNQLTGNPSFSWMEKVWGTDAGKLVKASAADSLDGRYSGYIGVSKESIAVSGIGGIKTFGLSSSLTGLTIGSGYYLSDTLGEISTTPGTVSHLVGRAIATDKLLLS